MAAPDSTVNGKPGSEKKLGTDKSADKKAASDAAALAKKLYDDSHPPATKPPSKPAAPEASQSAHGIMGWLSDTEKSASAALSNSANRLKEDVKADLKTVSAMANSVAARGDSVLAQFGALTISGIAESAEPKSTKPTAVHKTEPADKKVSDLSTAAPAGAAATKEASGAETPSSDSAATSGFLSSMANVVGSVASYVGNTVKSGLDGVMSQDTQKALLNAAELYGVSTLGVAGVAVAGLAGAGTAAALPEMIGMAGTAYEDYTTDFKGDDFNKSARVVDSFDNVSFASLEKGASSESLATQNSDAELLKKSATWFIAGDGKAGGTALIARKGDETTAEGITRDHIDYSVSSTPEKQSAKVGAIEISHLADGGISIGNADYTQTVKPPVTTLESKDHRVEIQYNSITHVSTLLDRQIGYKIQQNAKGVVTEKGGTAYFQLAAGASMVNAEQAAKSSGFKVMFAIDKDGNQGAFAEDGTSYELFKKSNELVVTKGQFKLVLETLHGKARLYELDPKTKQYVLTKPDPKTLPKGWVINGDSVEIAGQPLKKKGELFVHVLGARLDLSKGEITNPTKTGDVVLSSNGTGTKLTGVAAPTIETNLRGQATIALPGREPIHIDPVTGISTTSEDGTVASIAQDGSAKLVDGKTNQEADIDAHGNEISYNAERQQIFSMNNQGDMQLDDGTFMYHDGVVRNESRHINEPSYNDTNTSEAVNAVVSLSLYVGGGIELGASIASLESALAMLDSLGDIPGLAEQIGAAKENIQVKIYQAKGKEYLATTLAQAGKGTGTIEKALTMRGSGLSDQDIAERFTTSQHP